MLTIWLVLTPRWPKCGTGMPATKRHPLVEHRGRCQICQGRILILGVNDLATKRPDAAVQWNSERNGTLLPEHVKPCTVLKVWWRCPNGHEFLQSVANRCSYRSSPVR